MTENVSNKRFDSCHHIGWIVYELMETDSAIVRAVFSAGMRFDDIAVASWDDIVSMRMIGARRAARLCSVMEKYGMVPAWKKDMTEDRVAWPRYQKIRRTNS